jgi:ankyrin repeat protein
LLVRAGADIHTRKLDQYNHTLLQVAAGRGAIGAVGFLLDRGVPMNWSDDPESQEVNGTPLHGAAANGRHQVVEFLLSRGALSDLEKADWQGRSPLLCAASGFSDSSFLQYVDIPPSPQLDWEKTVRLLVDSGADLAVSDRRNLGSVGAGSASLTDTPLGYVSCWGSADIVRYLARKGSEIHQQRSYPKDRCFPYGVGGDKATPLHRGAHHWNADGVRALLELGAGPDATDEYGRQPLHWAAIGRCLSQGSLGFSLRCIYGSWSALLTEPQSPAHSAKLNALESTIKQLIVHKASIDRQDIFGRTPLHYAASMKLVGAVALLVESGADPGQTDDEGRTALHHLANPLYHPHTHEPLDGVLENERLRIVLAGRIRDVDQFNRVDNTGSTALHLAAGSASDAAVTLLIGLGADPSLPDREGSTPLHLAARRADWVILGTYAPDEYAAWSRRAARIKALLLAAGADASRCDALGRVPADVEAATDQELRDGRARYLEWLAAPRRDVGMGRGFGSGRRAADLNR